MVDEKRGPGRPRSIERHRAVLRATNELLSERRYAEVTMEGIAERAGVAKQTLYKWWPSRARLVMEAYLELVGRRLPIPEAERPRSEETNLDAALLDLMLETYRAFDSDGLGRIFAGLVADAQSDPELLGEFRESYMAVRRARVAELLREGISRGELPRDVDVELALDLLYGPMWIRLLVKRAPLDSTFAEGVVGTVLHGLRAATSALPARKQAPKERVVR
jgi:AcrR family transcriptional regulator